MTIKTVNPEFRQKLPNTAGEKNDKVSSKADEVNPDLLNVAKDFSSLFFDTFLQSMRKSVMKSEFLGGGHAEDMYQSMLDSEYAKLIAKQDQTGLAKMIADQLRNLSNVSSHSTSELKKNHAIEAYRMATKPPVK